MLPSGPQRRGRAGVLDGRAGRWRSWEGEELAEGSQTHLTRVALRYAFLLDKALLICKRRGDSYDLKNVVDLQNFQVRDDSSGERENKKVGCEARTGVPSAEKPQCSLRLST